MMEAHRASIAVRRQPDRTLISLDKERQGQWELVDAAEYSTWMGPPGHQRVFCLRAHAHSRT